MALIASKLCPVCGTGKTAGRDGLLQCHACLHVFQYPPEISISYDSTYISGFGVRPEEAMSCLRVGFIKGMIPGGKLLDVGFGTGAFIKIAMNAGFDAFGYDIHGEDFGVRRAPLCGADSWDVVTFFDSLEHFSEFGEIRSLSKRARLLVVSVPKTPVDLLTNRQWRHYKPGEHLHYFCEQSLAALFSPMRAIVSSDLEDVVRGNLDGSQNILTMVFAQSTPVGQNNHDNPH